MASFKKEFKELVLRGNVMDTVVGITIGGAFGKIVSSLADDILMFITGLFTGGINFAELAYEIKFVEFDRLDEGVVSTTTLNYRFFIRNVVDLFIITLVIFIMIHVINSLGRRHEESVASAPEPSDEVKLLTETRSLFDKKQ